MRTFYFQTKKESGLGTLYVRVRSRVHNLQIKISSRIQVDIPTWNKANSDIGEWKKFSKTKDGKIIIAKLQAVDDALSNLVEQGIFDRKKLDEAVQSVVYAERREEQRQNEEAERRKIEEEARLQAEREAAERADVIRFLEKLIEGMRKGSVKYKGASYSPNTVKSWNNFLGILRKFYEIRPFTWNDINKDLTDKFLCFMEREGYMVSAINKYLTSFRAMTNYALEQGLHDNAMATRAFVKRRISEHDKAREIYLTTDELQALYEMELTGMNAYVRDVFLVGCYTCQRFSDYSRISSEQITTTASGTKVIKLIQQKTGNEVCIPVANKNLSTILERYDNNLPKVNEQVLNRYIKIILKELSEKVPTLAEKLPTTLTMKEREKELANMKEADGHVLYERDAHGNPLKPRYEMVSSHTARRSGITNLYLTGEFDHFEMMSLSGHREFKTFVEYVKLTKDEIADNIATRLAQQTK